MLSRTTGSKRSTRAARSARYCWDTRSTGKMLHRPARFDWSSRKSRP